MGSKVFTNGTISSGTREGVVIANSHHVTFSNSVIHDFGRMGFEASKAIDLTVENNILNHIKPYGGVGEVIQSVEGWKKLTGGWTLSGGASVTFRNNTAASLWHRGFSLPSHKCGQSDDNIKDNVAHSISGFGVIVSKGGGGCNEFSDFSAYKIGVAAVEMGVGGDNHVRNVVTIDSSIGIYMLGRAGTSIEMRDNILYGS